jgi:hypothetical protein
MDEPQEIWNDVSECFAAVHWKFDNLNLNFNL